MLRKAAASSTPPFHPVLVFGACRISAALAAASVTQPHRTGKCCPSAVPTAFSPVLFAGVRIQRGHHLLGFQRKDLSAAAPVHTYPVSGIRKTHCHTCATSVSAPVVGAQSYVLVSLYFPVCVRARPFPHFCSLPQCLSPSTRRLQYQSFSSTSAYITRSCLQPMPYRSCLYTKEACGRLPHASALISWYIRFLRHIPTAYIRR